MNINPRADIRAELIPSSTRTYCACKGQASYWPGPALDLHHAASALIPSRYLSCRMVPGPSQLGRSERAHGGHADLP